MHDTERYDKLFKFNTDNTIGNKINNSHRFLDI